MAAETIPRHCISVEPFPRISKTGRTPTLSRIIIITPPANFLQEMLEAPPLPVCDMGHSGQMNAIRIIHLHETRAGEAPSSRDGLVEGNPSLNDGLTRRSGRKQCISRDGAPPMIQPLMISAVIGASATPLR